MLCHSRESGNPATAAELDSRFRGNDNGLVSKWTAIREVRASVTEAIEPLRREKVIGSSLEAHVTLPEIPLNFTDLDAVAHYLTTNICICSDITTTKGTHTPAGVTK